MGTHYAGSEAEIDALNTFIKLSRAAEATSMRINRHLTDFDLSVSQFGVLEALYHLGPMQVGKLGGKILKSSGNMTMVVDNLAKRGLVERQRRQDDRRCIDVHLSLAGRSLIERIMPVHVTQIVSYLSVLSGEEQAQLAGLCRKLGLAQGQPQP